MLSWLGIGMLVIFCALGIVQFILFLICFFFSKEEPPKGIILVVTEFSALDEADAFGRRCPRFFVDQDLLETQRQMVEKRGFHLISPDTPIERLWKK